MRDFYDIYILQKLHGEQLKKQVLWNALVATARKRGTLEQINSGDIREIFDEIEISSVMENLWKAYQKNYYYAATIGGILEQSDLKEYGFWEMTPYPVRIVVPDADARSFDWFSMPLDEDDYTEYARSVMDEYFPIVAEDSYVEQGYTVRIARTDAMIKMLNIAIVLAEIVMYGFVILLILMGFTSVISTLTTNIRIRSREFAVLKSVGMTNKSLCRMLYSESIFCVLNALVPGVIFGIAIPFLINLSIRKAFPVLYHIPWAALFGGIFVLIGIVFFITRTEIHKLRDKSIIDEIRMDIV